MVKLNSRILTQINAIEVVISQESDGMVDEVLACENISNHSRKLSTFHAKIKFI